MSGARWLSSQSASSILSGKIEMCEQIQRKENGGASSWRKNFLASLLIAWSGEPKSQRERHTIATSSPFSPLSPSLNECASRLKGITPCSMQNTSAGFLFGVKILFNLFVKHTTRQPESLSEEGKIFRVQGCPFGQIMAETLLRPLLPRYSAEPQKEFGPGYRR